MKKQKEWGNIQWLADLLVYKKPGDIILLVKT